MSSKTDEQEMLKRLRELEEENARLRNATKPNTGAKLTVTEGEYKGHPTLTFDGPFRSFTLGLKKLVVLKEVWPQVEVFLNRHAKAQSGQSLTDDGDDKT